MRKLVSFMHVSLDGFVASPKGELDWVTVNDEIFEYINSHTSESDTALYGRGTYEIMEAYWPTAADKPNATKHDIDHSRWYNKVHKVVLSKTMKGKTLPHTTIISDTIPEQVNKLKETDGKNIIIFGSPGTTNSLTQQGLVDEYWLFINPVILGQGIPLFKDIKEKIKLESLSSKVFSSGVICLHYQKISN
jgi:dihydrofolate reductase